MRIIKTFAKLREEIKFFKRGQSKFMVVAGEPGIGKTYCVQKELKNKNVLNFRGYTTPYQFIKKVYQNPTKILIIDDIVSFFAETKMVSLILNLTELREENEVYYDSNVGGIKSPFKSKNRIILIINELRDIYSKAVMRAIMTRADYIEFKPNREEILQQLVKFDTVDKEVVVFMKESVMLANIFNFRTYIKIVERKAMVKSYLQWMEYGRQIMELEPKREAVIKALKKFKDDNARLAYINTAYKMSRATYYKYKKKVIEG